MLRQSLSLGTAWAWPVLVAVALLAAGSFALSSGAPEGGAPTVAEAAALRQLMLRVAAAADEGTASGDATAVEAAGEELNASYRALSGRVVAVLGPEDAALHLAVLGSAITELTDAAKAYARGDGSAGAGGATFGTASAAVEVLVEQLARVTDRAARESHTAAVRAMLLLAAAALASFAALWRSNRRTAHLRRRAEAADLELSELTQGLPERIASEEKLRASEERFRTVLNTAQDGIMVVSPDGRLMLHNRALADLLGYAPAELEKISVGQLVPASALEHISSLLTTRLWSDAAPARYEVQMVRRDGEQLDIDMSVATFREADETVGVLVEVRDLTESKRAHETIRRMADYDALTGLPNRALFDRYVQQALDDAEHVGRSVAVLMLDMDRFKLINDTLGHPSGDRLLKAVARRLSAHLSPSHTLARFGGDEFMVLVADVHGREAAEIVARSIVDSFTAGFDHEGRELHVTCGVGVSIYPDHGDSPDALIRQAEAAMYRAKALGGNRYELYEPNGDDESHDRLSLEAELRHALERDEFVLHFQPQVKIESGEIVATEALIRWQHPDRGLVPPVDFIPLLEDTGAIVPVGEWVLRSACEQLRAWHKQGFTRLRVAVNLSARQFLDPGLGSMVESVLEETGLAPTFLELEVTETTAMQNAEDAIRVLQKLRDIGIATSLDDFGIGHSSLGRLKQFPVDTLKIDRTFVASSDESTEGAAIVRGIVALGHAMGLQVLGEGVETAAQLALLRSVGCDIAQGYLYSRALEPEAMAALLTDGVQLLEVA